MRRSDFHYELPDELIARHPPRERSGGRLLHLDGRTRRVCAIARVIDLPGLLRPGDLLVFNDTRVIPARLLGAQGDSGGRVEILLERLLRRARAPACSCARASRARRARELTLADGVARSWSVAQVDDFWERRVQRDPLHAYSSATAKCRCRRTWIAPPERGRSRALPDGLCARARRRRGTDGGPAFRRGAARALSRAPASRSHSVTLHVGAGTFQPVRVDDLAAAPHARRTV